MKKKNKWIVLLFMMFIFAVQFTSNEAYAVSKKNTAKIDGIVFVSGDSVTFSKAFTAYGKSNAKRKFTQKPATYRFMYKLSKAKAPYVFKGKDGKLFYVKEEQMPRNYLLVTYYSNGGTDKKTSAYSAYANGDGSYTIPIRYSFAKKANLPSVSSMFSYSQNYVNSAYAWRIGSEKSTIYANEDKVNLYSYCKGKKGPVKISMYANWIEYTMDAGINGTKYMFVNPRGIYSSVTLTPSVNNIPENISASKYIWTITKNHADQGIIKSDVAPTEIDSKGNQVIKGVKSIQYLVDTTCKNGNCVITVQAGRYTQKFMLCTYRWRAHRGNMDLFPENTVEAFIGACEAGAISIETDVQVTSDGKIVCFHDTNLKILGMEPKYELNDLEWKDLKELQYVYSNGLNSSKSKENLIKYSEICAQEGYEQDVNNTASLCPFETYLQICKYYNIVPSIEIKVDDIWTRDSFKEIGELLEKYGFDYTNSVVGNYSKSSNLIVDFSEATDYKYTIFWTDTDPDSREDDDFIDLDSIKRIDSNILHVGTVTEILGGEDYKVISTKQGYNVAWGQKGHDWRSFRGYACACDTCKPVATLSVATVKKTYKASALKKAKQMFNIGVKTNSNGKITCKKLSSSSSKISVSESGKIILAKKSAKGKYTIRVSIKVDASDKYKSNTIEKTISVTVK